MSLFYMHLYYLFFHVFVSLLSLPPVSPDSAIKPLFPLNPALETRLLCNRPWTYRQTDPNNTRVTEPSLLTGTEIGYKAMKAAVIMPCTSKNIRNPNTNSSAETHHLNQTTWANHYLSQTTSPSFTPATVTDTANGIIKKTTMAKSIPKITSTTTATVSKTSDISVERSRDAHMTGGGSELQSIHPRVRPVSFSLPKRSCVLLHQSAAIFIQASRNSGLSEKEEGVTVQARIKDGEKVEDQQHKSPISADVNNEDMDLWDMGKQPNLNIKTAIQATETAGRESDGMRTGTQTPLCNVIRVEDSVISRNEAEFSSCNGDGTGDQVCTKSGTEAHLYLNGGVPQENTPDNAATDMSKDLACRDNQPEVESQTQIIPTKLANGLQFSVMNLPGKIIFGSSEDSKELSSHTQVPNISSPSSNESKETIILPPSRPKEPFCHVQSRDGSRVLLWPSEMVSYTKTSPSISYSINPLLYDFRAHNRTKDGGTDKKGRLEERSERIKPSVIKQADSQQRQEVMERGREEKLDEREEDNEGGQAGNPMEVISHCSRSDTVLCRCGCRDESTLKLASEGHLEPTLGLPEMVRRRRRKRGGVRRKGRRKMGEKTKRENKIINSPFLNLEKGEAMNKEEKRETVMLSDLGDHRLVGGRKRGIKEEEKKIQGDQTEPVRAGRNNKKTGELLSDLPLNCCNRCNQLCAQVKREANCCQFQQSDSRLGQELRTLLHRGTASNSMISPGSGSVIQTPCCPTNTPGLARDEMRVIKKNTQVGIEGERWKGEQQRNLGKAEIRGVPNAEESMCNLVISGVTFPCREASKPGPEIGLVRTTHTETACDPAISLIPAPFRGTAGSQTQIIPAGHRGPALESAPCCTTAQTRAQLKIRSLCAHITLTGNEVSKEEMQNEALTGDTGKRKLPEAGETPRKKRKRGRRQARRIACALRNCAQQQERPPVQLITEIGVDEACMQDHEKALKLNSKDSAKVLETLSYRPTTEHSTKRSRTEENTQFSNGTIEINDGTTVNVNAPFTCHDSESNNMDCYCGSDYVPFSAEGQQQSPAGITPNNSDESSWNWNPLQDDLHIKNGKDCTSKDENPPAQSNNTDRSALLLSKDLSACSKDTRTAHSQCKNRQNESQEMSNSVISCKDKRDTIEKITQTCCSKKDHSGRDKTKHEWHIDQSSNLSDSLIDCSVIDQREANGHDDIDSGQCGNSHSNHASDCNHCADADQNATEEQTSASRRQETEQTDAEKERREEEEKERERLKERQREWEKMWVRRKEKEKKDRERRKERDIDHYPEKRSFFPHTPPPHCIPLHPPLLLPPSLSSASSSSSTAFSFHHTIVQHHLSLLPPPSAHLPVHPYPHLHPSFSPHLSPLALNPAPAPPLPPPPPPLPPAFYASPSFPLLDDPGPYPIPAAFHPLQSHHPSLYPPTYPTVLPLQMLF